MYTDISLDLETLGTAPGSVILSIGAVAFNIDDPTHRMLPESLPRFDIAIDVASATQAGFTIDPDTVMWWLRQSDGARHAMAQKQGQAGRLAEVLYAFRDFVGLATVGPDTVRVWGNGSDFDNVLLAEAYRKLNRPAPWKFWNNRCLRTLRAEHPDVPRVKPRLAHDALSDAEAQAATILAIKHKGLAFPETA